MRERAAVYGHEHVARPEPDELAGPARPEAAHDEAPAASPERDARELGQARLELSDCGWGERGLGEDEIVAPRREPLRARPELVGPLRGRPVSGEQGLGLNEERRLLVERGRGRLRERERSRGRRVGHRGPLREGRGGTIVARASAPAEVADQQRHGGARGQEEDDCGPGDRAHPAAELRGAEAFGRGSSDAGVR